MFYQYGKKRVLVLSHTCDKCHLVLFFSGFTSRKQLLKKGKDHIVLVKTLEYTNSSLSNNSNHVRPLNFNDKVLETLISHARDYCVVDVLPWGGMGGRDTNCKVPLIIINVKGHYRSK